jgi:phosphoribulokinase
MGTLKVLMGNEEEKIFWSLDDSEAVQKAREKFDHYQKQGFIAAKIVDQGDKGVQLSEFDPEAEEIFMLGLADGG